MKRIGMLDSPFVRRVAISLQMLGLRFEHQSLSVFRTFGEFQQLNPVVKAPTLVCDDGEVLMDSTLILQCAEALAAPRSLLLRDPQALQLERRPPGLDDEQLGQAGISIAVAWFFTQQTLPHVVPAAEFPRLAAFSVMAEALPAFRAAPHGEPVVPVEG